MIRTTTTIDYTYDALYRLTAADYDTGESFRYTYDAVGNRLAQGTLTGTNTYAYDIANRLTSVDGVTYSWDANGNLLSDGVSTYTYDHSNRLISVVQGADSYAFAYNGLGDRLQQTVNGVATNYTLDLASGLTQVFSDEADAYLYGVGRIGQEQSGVWQYHLGDALASVRQVSGGVDSLSYAQVFEPFGSRLNAAGVNPTSYGFTGEWLDRTELVNLRARYYLSNVGRFLAGDVWEGDPRQPLSFVRWVYAQDNPVTLTDPSGTIPRRECDRRLTAKECQLLRFLARRTSVTQEPPVSWSPSSIVHLETEIPEYTYGAQYTLGSPYGSNLCGQFALSMILETYTGLDIYDLIDRETNAKLGECASETDEEVPCGWPSSTLGYKLGRLLKLVAPSWRFQVHWTSPAVPEGSDNYASSAVRDLRTAMYLSHFVIALTSLEVSSGTLVPLGGVGHWVVVTGLSRDWDNSSESSILNWVRVNNPHNNAVEYYPWMDFNQSMLHANAFLAWRWLEIWPPPLPPREPPEL